MDKVKYSVLGLILTILMVGCQTEEAYQTELNQIDSLRADLSSYLVQLDAFDTDEVSSIAAHVDTQYAYLMANYPDQNDRDFWLKEVSQYGNINKSLGRLESHKDQIRETIEYADKQLRTLSNSIRDEKLTGEQIAEYLERERLAAGELQLSYNKYIAPTELALNLWDAYQEPYDSIVSHLRQTQ